MSYSSTLISAARVAAKIGVGFVRQSDTQFRQLMVKSIPDRPWCHKGCALLERKRLGRTLHPSISTRRHMVLTFIDGSASSKRRRGHVRSSRRALGGNILPRPRCASGHRLLTIRCGGRRKRADVATKLVQDLSKWMDLVKDSRGRTGIPCCYSCCRCHALFPEFLKKFIEVVSRGYPSLPSPHGQETW